MTRIAKPFVSSFLIMLCALSVAAAPLEAPDPAYVQSFEQWKAEQTSDLKENWLSLVGLFWLKPGANPFGADASNSIVFPKGPAHAGEFVLDGKDVTLHLAPDARATIAGQAVTAPVKLAPDISDHVTRVDMDTLRFHVIVRGQRIGIRVRDTDSAASKNFKGLVFYPLDLAYRTTATWVPSDGKKMVEVPNALGDVSSEPVPGSITFKLNGAEYSLTALGGSAASGLFFVFTDPTAKADTYPGGRFLDTGPIVNGHVEIDFNRAYNPPCAVTPYATCPLAPKENHLAVAITAGEKFDKAAHAHMNH